MITDSIMAAINIMINNCENEEHKKGMEMMGDMLADFDEDEWLWKMGTVECIEWVKSYLEV